MVDEDAAGNAVPPEVVQAIARQLEQPERVQVTQRAKYDMLARGVTTADVCDALTQWLDLGGSLRTIVTDKAPEHVGERAYVGYPQLGGREYYVKVTVRAIGTQNERLLLISAHESN